MTPAAAADREFWCAVYRAVMALAVAIKRYKLGDHEGGDTLPVTGAQTSTTQPPRTGATTHT